MAGTLWCVFRRTCEYCFYTWCLTPRWMPAAPWKRVSAVQNCCLVQRHIRECAHHQFWGIPASAGWLEPSCPGRKLTAYVQDVPWFEWNALDNTKEARSAYLAAQIALELQNSKTHKGLRAA